MIIVVAIDKFYRNHQWKLPISLILSIDWAQKLSSEWFTPPIASETTFYNIVYCSVGNRPSGPHEWTRETKSEREVISALVAISVTGFRSFGSGKRPETGFRMTVKPDSATLNTKSPFPAVLGRERRFRFWVPLRTGGVDPGYAAVFYAKMNLAQASVCSLLLPLTITTFGGFGRCSSAESLIFFACSRMAKTSASSSSMGAA